MKYHPKMRYIHASRLFELNKWGIESRITRCAYLLDMMCGIDFFCRELWIKMTESILDIIKNITEIIATEKNHDLVLQKIVDTLAEALTVDVCSVYIYDDEKDLLEMAATYGLEKDSAHGIKLKPREGLTGLSFTSREILNLSYPEKHPNFKLFEGSGELKFKSFLALPLNMAGSCIGVLVIQRCSPEEFPESIVNMTHTIAVQLAGIIVNTMMKEELARETKESARLRESLANEEQDRGDGEQEIDAMRTQIINHERVFSNYRVIRRLGEGNIGIVFLCERLSDRKLVAMKLLKCKSGTDDYYDELFYRFIHEANAISQLSHPNIVKFIEFGRGSADSADSPYIVMEYCDGQSLANLIDNEVKISLNDKIEIIKQVASALEMVHNRNILHRDIKPDNIIVDDDYKVKITDFGVCHLPSSDLTTVNAIIGTPSYLAPEYLLQGTASPAMDIYALGVVAYELFLGVRPFHYSNLPEYMSRIKREYPIEPRKLIHDFPQPLQEIIGKMLKKNPRNRFQRAQEIIDNLESYQKGSWGSGGMLSMLAQSVSGRDW